MRHHAEEDRQEFAPPAPGVVAECQHRGEAQQPIDADRRGEPGRIVGRRIDQLEPGEAGEQDNGRPHAEPARQSQRRRIGPRSSEKANTIRHGPYQGLIQYQRLPNSPCTSVRPTQSSVQTVSGSGLDSGSRLPKNPAATRAAKKAKDDEAERQPQALAERADLQPPARQPLQRLGPDEQQHEEARRHRDRAADEIVPGRQKQHMAAVRGVGEGRGRDERCEAGEAASVRISCQQAARQAQPEARAAAWPHTFTSCSTRSSSPKTRR